MYNVHSAHNRKRLASIRISFQASNIVQIVHVPLIKIAKTVKVHNAHLSAMRLHAKKPI